MLTLLASHSLASARSNERKEDDTLPPFPELLTDEQRELKASYYNPGTFNVIATPEIFRLLPEYRRKRPGSASLDRQRFSPVEQSQSIGPDTIILEKFEEFPEYRGQLGHMYSSAASTPSSISSSGQSAFLTDRERKDAYLLEHYRNVLARQICWLSEQKAGRDFFETYSEGYYPVS